MLTRRTMRRSAAVSDSRDIFRGDSSDSDVSSAFGEPIMELVPIVKTDPNAMQADGARAEALEQMLVDERFGDMTLRCVSNSGALLKEYSLNRAFLASASEVWREALFGDSAKSPVVLDIVGEEPPAVDRLVRYAYFLDPQISVSNALPIRMLAEKYKLNGLKSICDVVLSEKSLTPDNVCEMLTASLKYGLKSLTDSCMTALTDAFTGSQFKAMFGSAAFKQMPLEALTIVLKMDKLRIKEEQLWRYLMQWAVCQSQKANGRRQAAVATSAALSIETDTKVEEKKEMKEEKKEDVSGSIELLSDTTTMASAALVPVSEIASSSCALTEAMDFMRAVKYHIRFPLMAAEFLVTEVHSSGVLTTEEQFMVMKSRILKKRMCPFGMAKRKGVATFSEALLFRRGRSSSSWSYGGAFDALCITVDRTAALCGVGLWCADGGTEVSLTIFENNNGGSAGRTLREEAQQRFDVGRNREPQPFEFATPFVMEAGQRYCVELHQRNVASNSSYSCTDTRTSITEGGTTLTIASANSSPNSTSTTSGGFPAFYICTDV